MNLFIDKAYIPKSLSASYADTLRGLTKEYFVAAIGYEVAGHAINGGGLPVIIVGLALSHLSSVLGKKTKEAMATKLMSQ